MEDSDPQLKFAIRHRHAIVAGHKDATVRLPDSHGVTANDSITLVHDEGRRPFGVAYVDYIITLPVNRAIPAITKLNAGHNASTTRDLVRSLDGYYDREIDAATIVDVIVFRLVETVSE